MNFLTNDLKKNNRAHLLCHFKVCASFRSHLWIQTGVTVRKRSIWVKIVDFLARVTLKFNQCPWKTTGQLLYATSSFVHYFVTVCESKLELQSGNIPFGSTSSIFRPVWSWNLTDDVKQNNRAPLLCHCKLCASFHSHMWIQTGVTVQKRPNWGKICFDLYDLDLCHLTFTLCMAITFVNMMMRWQEHCEKVWETDGQTDGRTEVF